MRVRPEVLQKEPATPKDFKHTHDPDQRPKRAAKKTPKKKRKADDDDGDGDSYDESFIDDESEPDLTPDESDEEEWLPSPEDSD